MRGGPLWSPASATSRLSHDSLTHLKPSRAWHPQGPIHSTPPPRATTFHTAPRPARVARRAVVWGGVVLRNVVARGGWVDVGGPCGCQASRRAARCTTPKNGQGENSTHPLPTRPYGSLGLLPVSVASLSLNLMRMGAGSPCPPPIYRPPTSHLSAPGNPSVGRISSIVGRIRDGCDGADKSAPTLSLRSFANN